MKRERTRTQWLRRIAFRSGICLLMFPGCQPLGEQEFQDFAFGLARSALAAWLL